MKKAEAKEYKAQLLALRARLRGDVNQLADAALKKNRGEANGDLSSMPIHMADLGSDNFEQEFSLTLINQKKQPAPSKRHWNTSTKDLPAVLRSLRRQDPEGLS